MARPEESPAPGANPGDRLTMLCLALIGVAYSIWILSLPIFPTQDGPMHLLYTRIMQALIFHRDPGIYPQYYTIKHLLPPYSLYYYLLLSLGHFVPLVKADGIVICLYVFVFLFGFRYLACSLGSEGNSRALLASLLVLNWPLGMGFVNFCLSTALAMWALGLWCRVSANPTRRHNGWRRAGFVVLSVAIMMTHPIPLLLMLGFCTVDLALRFLLPLLRRPFAPEGGRPARSTLLRDALTLLLAGTTLLYVRIFTDRHVLKQAYPHDTSALGELKSHLLINLMIRLHSVPLFQGRNPLILVYLAAYPLLLLGALYLGWTGCRSSWRLRVWKTASTWFVLAAILIATIPFMPPDLNGSHFFTARMFLYIWLAALLGSTSASLSELSFMRNFNSGVAYSATFAVVYAVIVVVLGVRYITPASRRLAQTEFAAQPLQHRVGLMLMATDYSRAPGLTYDPYVWSVARVFRVTNSVPFNTPWLELAIIPVGAQPVMPTGKLDLATLESMVNLRELLTSTSFVRNLVFPQVDMAVFVYGSTPHADGLDPVLLSDPVHAHSWSCEQDGIFKVCQTASAIPH